MGIGSCVPIRNTLLPLCGALLGYAAGLGLQMFSVDVVNCSQVLSYMVCGSTHWGAGEAVIGRY